MQPGTGQWVTSSNLIKAKLPISELKRQAVEKERQVAKLSVTIESRRKQMRSLSKKMNDLIEKQMGKSMSKSRPQFSPEYTNQSLVRLQEELNSTYQQIHRIKHEISTHKGDQPVGVTEEIHSLQAKMREVDRMIRRNNSDKQALIGELQKNKEVLERLKENGSLLELEERQQELQAVRKECKAYQNSITTLTGEERQWNIMYSQICHTMQKQPIIHQKVLADKTQITAVIDDINKIYAERNQLQKEMSQKIKNLERDISLLEVSIREKHIKIRDSMNFMMRNQLEQKKKRSKLMQESVGNVRTVKAKSSSECRLEKIKPNPQDRNAPIRWVGHPQESQQVVVGSWISDGVVLSDREQMFFGSVERVKHLTFCVVNGELVGLKSVYITKNNLLQQGNQLNISQQQSFTEIDIHLEEVIKIYYSRHRQKSLYLCFQMNNGQYKTIGTHHQEQQSLETISFDQYTLQLCEAMYSQEKYPTLTGLRLTLVQKKVPSKAIDLPQMPTNTQHSFSSKSLTMHKRVVLKGKSLKKIKEEPIVDFRLQLGKKKAS